MFSFFTLLLSTHLMAANPNYGFYTGLNGGQANDTGKGIEEMKGLAYGLNFGYRWYYWALELGYSKYDLKAERGQSDEFFIQKAEMDASSFDVAVRTFLFRYFTFAFGINSISSDEDIILSNINGNASSTFQSKGETDYSGTFFQLGIVLPMLRNLDVWLLYHNRTWTADTFGMDSNGSLAIDSIDYNIQQFTANIIYYFN